jgi:hypothetical protein
LNSWKVGHPSLTVKGKWPVRRFVPPRLLPPIATVVTIATPYNIVAKPFEL